MRIGVKPNPKKDSDARRKSRKGWTPAKATATLEYRDVIVKGTDGKERRVTKRIIKSI